MIHDFIITENYMIIPDLPLEMDGPGSVKNARFLFNFNRRKPCRYGFIRRDDPTNQVKWYTIPQRYCHYVFHYANAFEEGNQIKVQAVAWRHLDINFQDMEHLWTEGDVADFIEMTFDMTKDVPEIEEILLESSYIEFPTINNRYIGRKHRYSYLLIKDRKYKLDNDTEFFNKVIKYDCFQRKIVGEYAGGDFITFSGECFFVPKSETDTDEEDLGYLFTTTHNSKENKSYLLCLDSEGGSLKFQF